MEENLKGGLDQLSISVAGEKGSAAVQHVYTSLVDAGLTRCDACHGLILNEGQTCTLCNIYLHGGCVSETKLQCNTLYRPKLLNADRQFIAKWDKVASFVDMMFSLFAFFYVSEHASQYTRSFVG